MHDGMPYGRNQGQGQGHSREVDRQSPTGLIFVIIINAIYIAQIRIQLQMGCRMVSAQTERLSA